MSLLDWRPDETLRPHGVDAHAGTYRDFLDRHRIAAFRAAEQGPDAIREFAAELFPRIADTRTLRAAMDHLAQHGGEAPGPNGRVLRDLSRSDKWELARWLSHQLREGHYVHGPVRAVHVPKASGLGKRKLAIEDMEDRIVGRAVVEIVQPILNPTFDAHSFCRFAAGPWHALACAEQLFSEAAHPVWIAEDIRDAFPHVPLRRLLDVVRNRLPADDLLDLVTRVVDNGNGKGLRQGSCLSPLLMNLYLDHFLIADGDGSIRRFLCFATWTIFWSCVVSRTTPKRSTPGSNGCCGTPGCRSRGCPRISIHDLSQAPRCLGSATGSRTPRTPSWSAPTSTSAAGCWSDCRRRCAAHSHATRRCRPGDPRYRWSTPARVIHTWTAGKFTDACGPRPKTWRFEEIGSQGEFVACWRRHGRWEAMLDRIRRYGFDSKTTGSASRRAPRHTVEDDLGRGTVLIGEVIIYSRSLENESQRFGTSTPFFVYAPRPFLFLLRQSRSRGVCIARARRGPRRGRGRLWPDRARR